MEKNVGGEDSEETFCFVRFWQLGFSPATWGSEADNVLKYDGAGVSTVRTFTLAGCTTGLPAGEACLCPTSSS